MSVLRAYPLFAGLALLAIGLAGSAWQVLPVSPWHDALHVALGLGGLAAFRGGSDGVARAYAAVIGGVYGALGVAGLVSHGAAVAMGYHHALHNLPHLLLAAGAVAVLFGRPAARRRART